MKILAKVTSKKHGMSSTKRLSAFIKDNKYYFLMLLVLFTGFIATELIGCCSILFHQNIFWDEAARRSIKALIFISVAFGSSISPLAIITINKRFYIPITLLLIFCLFVLANLLHMRVFSMTIPISMYFYTQNFNGLFDCSIGLLKASDIFFPVVFGIVLAVYFVIKSKIGTVPLKKRLITASVIFSISILTMFGYLHFGALKYDKNMPGTNVLLQFYKLYPEKFYCCFGSLSSFVADAANYFIVNKQVFTEEDNSQIESYLSSVPEVHIPTGKDSVSTKKNLIIILVESLNSKALIVKIGDQHVMPNTMRLIEDSQTLTVRKIKHLEQIGMSIAGQFNILTGLTALNDNVFTVDYPGNIYPSIIKSMKNKYENLSSTILIPTNKDFWGQIFLNSAVGMENLYGKENLGQKEEMSSTEWISDQRLFHSGIDKLKEVKDSPFHLLLVTGDMHSPYVEAPKSDLAFPENYPSSLKAYYTRAHNDDKYIGEFIDNLKKLDNGRIYEQSLIVISADHNILMQFMKGVEMDEDANNNQSLSHYTPVLFLNTGYDMTKNNENINKHEFVQEQIYPTMLSLLGLSGEKYTGLFPSILDTMECKQWDFSDISRMTPSPKLQEAFKISDLIIKSNYFGKNNLRE